VTVGSAGRDDWDFTSPGRRIALHVGEDKDPAPKLRAEHAEVGGAVELLTRGEVSKATNSSLISATTSLHLAFNAYVHSLVLFSILCIQDKMDKTL
jgi:hypothetical protein